MNPRLSWTAETVPFDPITFRRLYSALRHINRSLVRSRSREELLPEVCRAVVEYGGFLLAWVGWHDTAANMIIPHAQCGEYAHAFVAPFRAYTDGRREARCPAAIAFGTGKTYICDEFTSNEAPLLSDAGTQQQEIRAVAAFPLYQQGKAVGVLTVYASQFGYFQEEEIALLEEAAIDTSFALDNFAREEERQSADRLLQRFSAIVESTNDAVLSKSTDGTITSWNPAAERMFGYTAAEIVGRNIAVLIPSDRIEEEPRILSRIASGERIVDFETVRVRRDGRQFPVSLTISPIRSPDGTIVGASKILRDISDRKQAEVALGEAQARFEAVVENLDEGLVVSDLDGDLHSWNPAALKILGFPNREACPRKLEDFFALFELSDIEGAVLPLNQWPLIRIYNGESLRDYEVRVRRTTENWDRVISYSGSLVQYSTGKTLAFVTIRDITESKQAHEALRTSEMLLRNAESIAKLGSWELNLSDRRLRCSDQMFEIYKVDKAQFDGEEKLLWARADPHDRDAIESALNMARSGLSRLDIEHRIILQDGSTRILHVLGNIHGTWTGSVCVYPAPRKILPREGFWRAKFYVRRKWNRSA